MAKVGKEDMLIKSKNLKKNIIKKWKIYRNNMNQD